MKIWRYIEAHHEDLGVALFVIPASLAGLVIAAIAYGMTLLLFG